MPGNGGIFRKTASLPALVLVASLAASESPPPDLVDAARQRGGLVVDFGCGRGDRLVELGALPNVVGLGLEEDAKAVSDVGEAEVDEIRVYVCLTPAGPLVNRLIDQERLRPVYIGWGAARFGTQGFLHRAPNTNNQLPAGDTHVLYPGDDEPWSSTRFEAHRIGMKDRELLVQLQAKDPLPFDQIVSSVFCGYDDYERHVPAYRFAKRRLPEALDE